MPISGRLTQAEQSASVKLLGERASVQRVNADRKRDADANLAVRSAQVAAGQP